MTSGRPRPATTGSASRAPCPASVFISGSGLISLFIGMKPETIAPGTAETGNGRRGDRFGGGAADISRQRVAPRDHLAAQFGFCGLDFGHVLSVPP